VKQQLGEKTHWQESNDLEMMFSGTYVSEFYRALRNLLLALDPEVLEAVLREWIQAVLGSSLPETLPGVSLDGKTLCNTITAHERNVHLLSLFDQFVGGVLGQHAVDPTTNEAKAALDFLKAVVLEGRLVTGDAMFCQRDLCQEVTAAHADYLLMVKDNQPELKAAIQAEFEPGFSPL
jgi:hypothetical protein